MNIDAIKTWQQRCEEHPDHNSIVSEGMIHARMQEEIDELRAAIEQAQEPVAWMYEWDGRRNLTFTDQRFIEKSHPHFNKSTPLYTAPHQWQGLTDEEIAVIMVRELGVDEDIDAMSCFARAIEAKLRERNT